MKALDGRQLTGRDETHLVALPGGHRLQAEAAEAFVALQEDARTAGIELTIASSYRSFARQLLIWNAKAAGDRPVYDDGGHRVAMDSLSHGERVQAILRYSALPGSSRHHWGTDLDVFDAAAVADDYRVQLSPEEVSPGGVFDPLHQWLDERIGRGESRGFFRPYAVDRGGVAQERWHLSFAPLSVSCAKCVTGELLRASWDELQGGESLLLRDAVENQLDEILRRYVEVPHDWCPQAFREK